MANTRPTTKTVHLFNCDNLCDLKEVESLLKAVEKNVAFRFSKIEKHGFSGRQMNDVAEKKIPNLRGVDYAMFVVHAHECSLSFNDDTGYGKIYAALKKRAGSDANILIVIGGDDKYKNEDEKERDFLSSWARAEKGISRQFRTELMDGRKSFIFSWNKKHRPIHEEALRHYFDSSKKGQKFRYAPEPMPLRATEPDIDPPATVNIQQEARAGPVQEPSNEEETVDGLVEEHFDSSSDSTDRVVLDTYLRYGEISFASRDVQIRDRSWRPPKSVVDSLKRKWGKTRIMGLTIFVDGSDEVKGVYVKPTNWSYCPVS